MFPPSAAVDPRASPIVAGTAVRLRASRHEKACGPGVGSDAACGQVLDVPVAIADLGPPVPVGVEAEDRCEHSPDGESCENEEDDRGHGSKSMACDILPKV